MEFLKDYVVPGGIALLFSVLGSIVSYFIQLSKLRNEIKQDLTKHHEAFVRSDILPVVWVNLLNALSKLDVMAQRPLYYETEFNNMSKDKLVEFLKDSPLSEIHRNEFLGSLDKNKYYKKTIYWYDLADAKAQYNQFHNHVLYNKIHLNNDLSKMLMEMDKKISDFLNILGVYNWNPNELIKIYHEFKDSAEGLRLKIENTISKILNT